MGQSQLTMQEVQLKIEIIKNLKIKKLKNPTTVCFPQMGSSGGVETYLNRFYLFYLNKLLSCLTNPLRGNRLLWGFSIYEFLNF